MGGIPNVSRLTTRPHASPDHLESEDPHRASDYSGHGTETTFLSMVIAHLVVARCSGRASWQADW